MQNDSNHRKTMLYKLEIETVQMIKLELHHQYHFIDQSF